MSNRGRGRGGRGQPRRDHPPPPSPSTGGSRSASNPPPPRHQQPRPPSPRQQQQQPPHPPRQQQQQPPPPPRQQQQQQPPPPPRQQQQPPPSHSAPPPQFLPLAAAAGPSSVQASQPRPLAAQQKQAAVEAGPSQARAPPTSSKALALPKRPGFGTAGRRCVVRANHFLVKIADRDLCHYDVTISPEVTSKKVCRLIMQELVTCYRESHLGKLQVAYDGVKSMYTAGELPFSVKDFVVELDKDDIVKRGREFKVSIKFVAKPDLHHLNQFLHGRQSDVPQDTIQVLDVVLRSKPSIIYTVVGRSFFDKVLGDTGSLGEGLEYCKGFYQSLRPTQMGLSLNIDVSARAFFEPIFVTEFVAKYLNIRNLVRPMSDQDRNKIKKALKGIKVVLANREGGKRYKINGFTPQPLRQLKFVDDTGRETSVVQYYRDRYEVILNQTVLPAIQAGNDSKPVYLPMELCKIVSGQRYTKKLNERQVTALLKATCQRPLDRENSIKRMVGHNNYSNDVVVTDFGIQVNCELTCVDARVLPPPQLQYRGTQENPRVGSWNMINKRLVNAGRVDFWTCVNFSGLTAQEAEKFCEGLADMCSAKGMYFHPNPILPHLKVPSSQIETALIDIHTQSRANIARVGHDGKHLQLLIVILPGDSDCYGKIKRICETELGIVSQCCRPRRDKLSNKQYLENLSLKINVKVGGRNTVLLNAIQNRIPNLTDRPTIIFGADVTHPPPGEDSNPSIAAVVASMDWPEVTKYRGLVSVQPHRDEIIHDLYTCIQDAQKGLVHGGFIREQMIAFRRLTGFKPERIIFYRDGVSEGQFSQVLLYEMDKIRKACASLEADYMPRVTFLVVQKRHHTRLFAADPRDRNSTDRSGNILPGTVVDTKICHPTEFDFYLCSHAGIQGTSRPAHYHVLFDENDFTADQLQSLTNNLCYTFARCTRAVSIVPPAYYAHLAAFRARYYLEGGVASDSESGTGGGPVTRERVANVRALPAIKDNVKEVMFYC